MAYRWVGGLTPVLCATGRNGEASTGLHAVERSRVGGGQRHRLTVRCRLVPQLSMAPKFRNRRLFETTKNDENAMAAPATSGLSNPAAAIGMAAML